MMFTIYLQTLWESLHRRVALAMLIVAILACGGQFTASFHDVNGHLMVHTGQSEVAAATYVRDRYAVLLRIVNGPWLLLGIFAIAPLLSSHLERGWAELLFAKGVARWQIVTARVAGALSVWVGLLAILGVIPCLYLAWRAAVSLTPFFVAMGLLTLSFVAYIALMLLASTAQPNPAALIAVGFVQIVLSTVLARRKELYNLITWKWVQWLIDWAYRILPKNADLSQMGERYLGTQRWESWWPVWTTVLFIVVTGAWSYWRFERRAL